MHEDKICEEILFKTIIGDLDGESEVEGIDYERGNGNLPLSGSS
jgi:hypothetical protein